MSRTVSGNKIGKGKTHPANRIRRVLYNEPYRLQRSLTCLSPFQTGMFAEIVPVIIVFSDTPGKTLQAMHGVLHVHHHQSPLFQASQNQTLIRLVLIQGNWRQ